MSAGASAPSLQTKKRSTNSVSENDMLLPGWSYKQRHDFFEAIKIHGLKKLKKLQRHIGTKTQEDVRIAVEMLKREIRNRELTHDMERQIEEAGVSPEDYKTWLYFYMAAQAQRGDHAPIAALEAFFNQGAAAAAASPAPRHDTLCFPMWRQQEIKDFLATIELATIIQNIQHHIPTKSELEITGAMDAYTIICDARNHALDHGQRVPSYEELKSGYIYLQCIVAALNDNEALKNLRIPPKRDPDMERAKFVLKEYLMPDPGILPVGWNADQKYSLLVAMETFGHNNFDKIHSCFPWKTRVDVKSAVAVVKKESEFREGFYEKKRWERYLSLASWGTSLTQCTDGRMQSACARRLIAALRELPQPRGAEDATRVFRTSLSDEELTSAVLDASLHDTRRRARSLIPMLQALIRANQPHDTHHHL